MASIMGSLTSLSSRMSSDTSKDTRQLCQTDPYTTCGRVRLFSMLLVMPSWPAVISIIVAIVRLANYTQSYVEIERMLNDYKDMVTYTGKLTSALQNERLTLSLDHILKITNASTKGELNLKLIYSATDAAVRSFKTWSMEKTSRQTHYSKISFMEDLEKIRNYTQTSNESDRNDDVIRQYTSMIHSLIKTLPDTILSTANSDDYRYYSALLAFIEGTEAKAMICLLGQQYLIQGFLDRLSSSEFIQNICIYEDSMNVYIRSDEEIAQYFSNFEKETNFAEMERYFETIENNSLSEPSLTNAFRLYNVCLDGKTGEVDFMSLLAENLREKGIIPARNYNLYMLIFFALQICLLIPILFFLAHNALLSTESIFNIVTIFISRTRELKNEKRKSELLLQEMLPKFIAKQLKIGRNVHAQYFETVTVYFSDVTDFTEISSQSEPMQIVSLLNSIYNFMDSRLELYDVYKVETISSVYMVASGLPVKNEHRHLTEISHLALDIMEATKEFSIPHLPDRKLSLRVGIQTGSVVAGVVGNKTPRYCLFGDTVNTASRMQSTGEAHKIQITSTMNKALARIGGFTTEHRGTILVKGKGSMNTYWLTGRVEKRSRSKTQVTVLVQAKEGMLIND